MTDATFPFPFRELQTGDDAESKRSRRRDSLFLAARLAVDGGEPIEIRVRNLSEGGLMAEGAPPVSIGDPVVVEMRNVGRVPGKIAWYTDNRAGVAFDAPIDPKLARKPVLVRPVPAGQPVKRPC